MPFSGSGTGIQNADDVFFSSLSENDILLYDLATAKWNNSTSIETLATAPAGSVFRCPWNGSAWTYDGVALSARPSSRTNIFFGYVGAPAATADPTWALAGDWREDV